MMQTFLHKYFFLRITCFPGLAVSLRNEEKSFDPSVIFEKMLIKICSSGNLPFVKSRKALYGFNMKDIRQKWQKPGSVARRRSRARALDGHLFVLRASVSNIFPEPDVKFKSIQGDVCTLSPDRYRRAGLEQPP